MPKPKNAVKAEFKRKPWDDLRRGMRGERGEDRHRSAIGYFLDPWTAFDYLEALYRIERELVRIRSRYGERAARFRFESIDRGAWIDRALAVLRGCGRGRECKCECRRSGR